LLAVNHVIEIAQLAKLGFFISAAGDNLLALHRYSGNFDAKFI
jgi:hypothetical protein